MSLKIAKNNVPAYDYYSEGDGSDPISSSAALSNGGGSVNGSVVTAYLVATAYQYQSITVQPITEQAGINWQASLNNVDWAESVTPSNMDARVSDQVTPIYFRPAVANDGSVVAGSYVGCDVRVTATEVP